MPYKAFTENDEYCVYKLDDNDEQTGSSLGCHPTMEEANQQIAALNAEEETDNEARNIFNGMWQRLKNLFTNREIKRQDELLQETLDKLRGEFNKQFNADDNWYNWLVDASDTFVIADFSGTMYKVPYQIVDENVIFAGRDEWREVVVSYEERAISNSQLIDSLWQRMFDLDMQIEGSDHYLVDMYHDDNGFYALYVDRGKLYRYDLTVQDNDIALGERVEVMEVHQPVESRTVIRQQPDGKYRWFSISGTAVLNRSGEIDSRDLFDSFIQNAESTGEYPIRQFYHQGESFRTGQATHLFRDNYCYITSGLYDDSDIANVERMAIQNNPDYWGESIGFLPTVEPELTEISEGIKIPVYKEGVNREISTLPENQAAHLFTRTEVTMSLEGKMRDAYLKLWEDAGMTEEDALKWLADNPQARNRAIEDTGMITREGESESTEETPPEEQPIEETPEVVEVDVDEELVGALGITELSDRLTQVETQLAERSKTDKELLTTVQNLTERFNKWEKGEQVIQQQINDDAPAKFKQPARRVYRPRFNGNVDPGENGQSYAERAMANAPKERY